MSPLSGIYCVTGGSQGVGKLLCSTLLDRGATVVNLSRSEPALAHANLYHIETDLSDSASIKRACSRLQELTGSDGLAGLIANAGVTNPAPFEESTDRQWRDTFEVNVFSHVELLRCMFPALRSRKGRIVFTSSVGGIVSSPLMSAYCGSKHAIEGIANALRIEVAELDVKVSVVQPAAIRTNILLDAPEQILANTNKHGPYAALAEKVAGLMSSGYEQRSSDPEQAVRVIMHALTATKPRHHYVVGTEARVHSIITRRLPSSLREWLIKQAL